MELLGASNWEFTDDQTSRCAQLLNHFFVVSVREESGVDLCSKYLKYKSA